jgi:hypothetical protein
LATMPMMIEMTKVDHRNIDWAWKKFSKVIRLTPQHIDF